MSVEFRQRTPGEYAKIAWKRKWLIILPAIAIATAVSWVVFRLPDLYESSTLIVVKPSTLPNYVVPTTTEDSLTRQINSIAQVVTSRSSLEPLIQKFDLYKTERQRGEPMELLIEYMRKSIKVEVNTSRQRNHQRLQHYLPRARSQADPGCYRRVGKQIHRRANKEHDQLHDLCQTVYRPAGPPDEGRTRRRRPQRLDFMQKNVGNLPSEAASLVGQLTGLREQQKAYISEVGRMQDRRSALTSQLALVKKSSDQMKEDVAENTTDPKTTLAWSQLVARKADLESQLTRMLTELRPKHPDVLAKQAEVDSVNTAMAQMVDEWKERIKEKQEKLRGRPDLTVSNLEVELQLVDGEIKRQQGVLAEIDKQVSIVMGRINNVPGAEVTLGALDRDYQTRKHSYDQLLLQAQQIGLGADAASQQQGEGIQVVDPANLPARPVAPKRLILVGGGIGLGFAVGFLLVGLFEAPRLLTIQTSEDAAHYTGLPVLLSVPELLTAREARSRPRRRKILVGVGVAAAVLAIPALALILQLTQVFERFVV